MSKITELQSFHFCFQITKNIVFSVNYYRLGKNNHKYFSTSAAQFNQRKTDFDRCGQAQKALLTGKARQFFSTWDRCHLKDLSETEHSCILADIEVLKDKYNYIKSESEIRFSEAKKLSMLSLKK